MVSTKRVKRNRKKLILLIAAAVAEQQRKVRECSIRPLFLKRNVNGEYFLLKDLQNDHQYHKKYFRMKKESFDQLFTLVKNDISHSITHSRPIPPQLRLAVTIRFLATGCSQTQLALSYRISPSSVGHILRETMTAIIDKLEPLFLPPSNHDIWKKSEQQFRERWNFPFCVGAIDGKHVRMRSPWKSGSLNHNYKGYFSRILLAVVGGDYRFLAVDIGAPGSKSDGAIFAKSNLYKSIVNKSLMLPENGTLADTEVPHVFVGDEAFPLKPWLMRPFPGNNLDVPKRIFNYRLSRARRIVENAFGIWAARWRILFSSIDGDADLVQMIIRTTIILHNFLREQADREIFEDVDDGSTMGNWRENMLECVGVRDIPRVGSNNYSIEAFNVRETFVNYFSSNEGMLPWQEAYVMRS